MKRWLLLIVLVSSFSHASAQSFADTLRMFFGEFHLSAEAGYNYLLPSASDFDDGVYYGVEFPGKNYNYGFFHHHQWNVAVAAENNVVKWKLAMGRDYLGYEYCGSTFDADYLRTSLTLQFFILKKKKIQILWGPSLELGWITRYVYSYNGTTLRNPDIGKTTGINLLLPLTLSFGIGDRSRVFLQVAGGVHLQDDHEMPYPNHWGSGPGPEAELKSYCPFSVGLGYSFLIN